MFHVNYNEYSFHVWKIEKQPIEVQVISVTDVVDEKMDIGSPQPKDLTWW